MPSGPTVPSPAPSCRRRVRRAARSTSRYRCSTRWPVARPLRGTCCLALTARVHIYLRGIRHPHRGPGADGLPPAERRAPTPRPSRRRPARSSCSRPSWRSRGSIRCRPTPRRAAASPWRHGQAVPAHPHHRRSREELPPLRFRDQPWALKVSPDPRLTMHPTPRDHGAGGRRVGASRGGSGKGPCRLRIKL